MLDVNNIKEFILNTVREQADDSKIVASSNISEDVGIDSIGWLNCLIQIEKQYDCIINPQAIFSQRIVFVQDFIDVMIKYIENFHNFK